MAEKKTFVGNRYGMWTVIGEGELRGRTRYYLCRCDCGNERLVSGGSLRNGRSQSCGCVRYPYTTHDLTGEAVGAWTVLSKTEIDDEIWYRCRCICGREETVKANEMYQLAASTCGCSFKRSWRKIADRENKKVEAEEIGRRCGDWTILRLDPTPRASRQRYYICRCVCGTERSVRRSALLDGSSRGCGCKRKSGAGD